MKVLQSDFVCSSVLLHRLVTKQLKNEYTLAEFDWIPGHGLKDRGVWKYERIGYDIEKHR